MSNNPPKTCPECGGNVVEKKGTSRKTNEKYHFWGCANYPDCNWTWNQPQDNDPDLSEEEKEMASERLNGLEYRIKKIEETLKETGKQFYHIRNND